MCASFTSYTWEEEGGRGDIFGMSCSNSAHAIRAQFGSIFFFYFISKIVRMFTAHQSAVRTLVWYARLEIRALLSPLTARLELFHAGSAGHVENSSALPQQKHHATVTAAHRRQPPFAPPIGSPR